MSINCFFVCLFREMSPAPAFDMFGSRSRRYSASCSSNSPVGGGGAINNVQNNASCNISNGRCLTPRISQLRQEESLDINFREIVHEREIHNVIQMSQSWEDLTLVAENWSCKSDDLSNSQQQQVPSTVVANNVANICSSPSPTSSSRHHHHHLLNNVPHVISPSPTRRVFATRRSMSPIAIRPSQLYPMKRKMETEENNGGGGAAAASSNWNNYTQQPPMKKLIIER